MAVQTTYSIDHAAAYAGQVVDSNDAAILSALSEGVILPGSAVIEGSAAGSVITPTGAGTFKGVAVRVLDREATSTQVLQYEDEEEVPTLRRGRVAVVLDETVVPGDPVFFVHTGGDEGRFRNDVTDAQVVVGAEFVTGGTVGQIAVINIPSAEA